MVLARQQRIALYTAGSLKFRMNVILGSLFLLYARNRVLFDIRTENLRSSTLCNHLMQDSSIPSYSTILTFAGMSTLSVFQVHEPIPSSFVCTMRSTTEVVYLFTKERQCASGLEYRVRKAVADDE